MRFYELEDREEQDALELMEKIIEELQSESFTLREIAEAFNCRTWNYGSAERDFRFVPARYGRRHLDLLVKMGMLNYDKESRSYCVNDTMRFNENFLPNLQLLEEHEDYDIADPKIQDEIRYMDEGRYTKNAKRRFSRFWRSRKDHVRILGYKV